MSDSEANTVRERLARLSMEIDETIKALNDRGVLSARHEAYAGDLKKRQAELHARLESAVRNNDVWAAMKEELELDTSALFSEFRSWTEELDTGRETPPE